LHDAIRRVAVRFLVALTSQPDWLVRDDPNASRWSPRSDLHPGVRDPT